MNKRDKCIIEALELLERDEKVDDHLFNHLADLLNSVEEQGEVRASMFKKLHIGGMQKIFVLTFLSRIVIHFLETIYRTLCEVLPGEMLTKGTNKVETIDKHFASF